MTRLLPPAVLAVAVPLSLVAFAAPDPVLVQAANRDAQTLADFQTRVKNYLTMRQKLASGLPALSDKATSDQVEAHHRALGQALMAARKSARKGDLFSGDMTVLVRRLLAPVFKGPDGAAIRNAILEEPQAVVPTVNSRYPDEVPVSTMPAEILKALPKIDESLEYRFIGRHLILLDVPTHLIVDVVDNAMPS